ncbi:MAG TPA: hypothetical protein VKO43_09105 [Candidatus Krumholzibacteriaceae bacterium]|nr:hypothetical protein [Candidatus Krumholzibacteriaceae bacterium]
MKNRLLISLFILGLSVLSLVYQAIGQDSQKKRSEGLVIYRDRILKPPFKFTGIEEDTLRLNGIPYSPVRRYKEERRKWKEKRMKEEIELMKKIYSDSVIEKRLEEGRKITQMWKKKPEGTHELNVYASNCADSAETFEEEVATYARILEESPLVDSTRILKDKRVVIYWKDITDPEYATLVRDEKPPLTDQQRMERRNRYHTNHVNDFWKSYNKGGTVVFGGFGGYLYSRRTEETLRAIEKLSRGDTLTAQEKEKSIFCGGGGRRILYLFKERFRREGKGGGENE